MTTSRQFECITAQVPSAQLAAGSLSFDYEIPEELIERSEVLQNAVNAAGDGAPKLVLPQAVDCSYIAAWAELVRSNPDAHDMSARSAVQGLLAADLFADEEAVAGFCCLLVEHMFSTPPRLTRRKSDQELNRGDSRLAARKAANEKIIRQLPRQLAVKVLAKVTLVTCTRYLPSSVHELVLEAQQPEAFRKNELTLTSDGLSLLTTAGDTISHDHIFCAPERVSILNAVGALSHLTSLCIHDDVFKFARVRTERDSYLEINRAGVLMLESLVSLKALHFNAGISACSAIVLKGGLSNLVRLECYKVSGSQAMSEGVSLDNIVSVMTLLSKLKCLKTLSFDGFLVNEESVEREYSCLSKLFHEMKQTTTLKSLTLRHFIAQNRANVDMEHISFDAYTKVVDAMSCTLEALVNLESLVLEHTIVNYGLGPALGSLASLGKLTCLSLHTHYIAPDCVNLVSRSQYDPYDFDAEAAAKQADERDRVTNKALNADILLSSLVQLTQLISLDVSGYELSVDRASDIANAVCGMTKLTRLLWGGPVQGKSKICDTAWMFSGLVIRRHNGEACELFWSTFAAKCDGLVDLRSFSLTSRVCWTQLGAISAALSKLSCLQQITMNKCCSYKSGVDSVEGFIRFIQTVRDIGTLTQLDLSGSSAGKGFVEALSGSLATMRQLRELSLEGWHLSDADILLITSSLEECFGADWERGFLLRS